MFPGSNPNEFGIVSAHEPRRMTKPPTPCLVAGWKVKPKDDMYRLAEPVVVRELAQKVSSMTVSDDGKLIGLGCSDGSVDVFSSCGMELVLRYKFYRIISTRSFRFEKMWCEIMKEYFQNNHLAKDEPNAGLEPATVGLRVQRSTD